jgi:signal transduction histidine kinase
MSEQRSLLEPLFGTPEGNAAIDRISRRTIVGIIECDILLFLVTSIASYAFAQLSLRPLIAQREREQQFLADAAHELRTPLAAIASIAQACIPQDEALRHSFSTIISTALNASSSVSDLLMLARNPQLDGRSAEPLDLSMLVQHVIDDYRMRAVIPIVMKHATGVYVIGDNRRLERLLGNLLDNALRHAHYEVCVYVKAFESRALLIVDDDGPGVASADRERIFERFYSTRPEPERSGLGLPICLWIARAHEGTISVEGARFTVSLPLATVGRHSK